MATWIIVTQWAARGVLLVLLGLSVWSVAIMLERAKVLKALEDATTLVSEARALIEKKNWTGLTAFVGSESGAATELLYKGALRSALAIGSSDSENIQRSVRSYLAVERGKLEKGFTTLATLGANAPFIGLFGTVLGIIQAFGVLGHGESNTTSVMAAISEALVATAVGLFVAIPAVVAYNIFTRKLKLILTDCESLIDLYLSRLDSKNSR